MLKFITPSTLRKICELIDNARIELSNFSSSDKSNNSIGLHTVQRGDVYTVTNKSIIIENFGDGIYITKMFYIRLNIGTNINLPKDEIKKVINQLENDINNLININYCNEKNKDYCYAVKTDVRRISGYYTIGIHN